jgi:hypothetical protein
MRQHSVFDDAAERTAQSGAHITSERKRRRLALDLSGTRDRQIVADALRALLRERSEALHLATRIAAGHRHPRPDPRDFGLSDILRLSRLVERGNMSDTPCTSGSSDTPES